MSARPVVGRDQVLITGADGYLGRRLAERWLHLTDDELILWTRTVAGGAGLARALGPYADRWVLAAGDLGQPGALAGLPPGRIRAIVHAAAVTRFNVDRDTAERVNVGGTEEVLSLAGRCPRLFALGLVSSIYASGLLTGPIAETRLAPTAFGNEYEWSKWAAEEALFRRARDLPAHVFRLPTLIADDGSGVSGQRNAFHHTVQLLYAGLLSTLPGQPGTPVYLATADLVVDAVITLMARAPRPGGEVWHVCPGRERSLTVDQVVDALFAVFEDRPAFRRRRLLRPLYLDQAGFALLAEAATQFGSPPVREAFASVLPFAPQLYLDKQVANGQMVAALPRFTAPDPRALVEAACRRLLGAGDAVAAAEPAGGGA